MRRSALACFLEDLSLCVLLLFFVVEGLVLEAFGESLSFSSSCRRFLLEVDLILSCVGLDVIIYGGILVAELDETTLCKE